MTPKLALRTTAPLVIALIAAAIISWPWGPALVAGFFSVHVGLTFLLLSKMRRPQERWLEWWLRTDSVLSSLRLRERRVYLACGHRGLVKGEHRAFDPNDAPELAWCPGHRWFGPAELHAVVAPPMSVTKESKLIVGIELAP